MFLNIQAMPTRIPRIIIIIIEINFFEIFHSKFCTPKGRWGGHVLSARRGVLLSAGVQFLPIEDVAGCFASACKLAIFKTIICGVRG